MSWLAQLHKTYEQASQLDWLPEDQQLPPIGHTSQAAHIHVVLNESADLIRAEVLPKSTSIFLPCTEGSAGRAGSTVAPHALADQLKYLAKDYANFGGNALGGKGISYFDEYAKQLGQWVRSEHSHYMIQAVYNYIQKGTLTADLIEQGILVVDENKKLLNDWLVEEEKPEIFKILSKNDKKQYVQGNALIAWSVEKSGEKHSKSWTSKTLQDLWLKYLFEQDSTQGFCFVQGNRQSITVNHPNKIMRSAAKAKLISANDKTGYTFRGRFLDSQQAVSISTEVSQKAHAALIWLINIRKQVQMNGEQATVAWALSGQDIPNPLEDRFTELDLDDLVVTPDENNLDNEPLKEDDSEQVVINQSLDLGQKAAQALRYKLKGYAAKLTDWDQLTVLSLDSATPGRMAITYYQQFMPDDYFQALEQWQTDFAWFIRHSIELPAEGNKKPKNKTVYPFVAPTPYAIAQAAFGKALTDEFKKQTIQRLLPNILEPQRAFPLDVVQRCFALACNRQGFEPWEWQRNLGVTCAVIKGYYARHSDIKKRRSFTVALDENNHSRDYLYGRLLAVAEEIESLALYIAGENRATSAERYFQQFANRPFTTWLTISTGLRPYQDRLRNSRAGFLKNREDEITLITSKFESNDFKNDTKLSGEFLLGYHNQKMSYQKSKSTTTDSTEQTTV